MDLTSPQFEQLQMFREARELWNDPGVALGDRGLGERRSSALKRKAAEAPSDFVDSIRSEGVERPVDLVQYSPPYRGVSPWTSYATVAEEASADAGGSFRESSPWVLTEGHHRAAVAAQQGQYVPVSYWEDIDTADTNAWSWEEDEDEERNRPSGRPSRLA